MSSCEHRNEILDARQGEYVCEDCGQVLDSFFVGKVEKTASCYSKDVWLDRTKDILDRFHIPITYSSTVVNYFKNMYVKKTFPALLFSIYKILNDQQIYISLHDLSVATGTKLSDIYANQTADEHVFLDLATMAEKYCCMLELTSEVISVIKKKLKETVLTGHSPSTVIAGTIYKCCRQLNIPITIKKVADITNVSCISIQRFNHQRKC